MSARSSLLAVMLLCVCTGASAQDLLIRNATVHTATARGTLQHADVLVHDGRISAVGSGLAAGNAQVVDAQGAPLTPTLFGGITDIGLEEISAEDPTTDGTLTLGDGAKHMTVRPEFDVTLAYNPESGCCMRGNTSKRRRTLPNGSMPIRLTLQCMPTSASMPWSTAKDRKSVV